MGSSHVVFLNIFFYGDVTQKRHWQKNLPVGFNGLNLTYMTWLFHPSPSTARLPVDEPALASIMTHDHAKDLCASEHGPLKI